MVFECDSDHSHPTRPDLARPAHQGCNHPVSTPSEQTQQFALAPALRTRLLGTGLAAIGVVTAVVVIAGSLLGDGSLVSGPLVSPRRVKQASLRSWLTASSWCCRGM